MLNNELAYYVNSMASNVVNESEEVAVRMNCRLLFSFKELKLISNECYSKCYFLLESNEASDVATVQSMLAEELNLKDF